MLGDQLLSFQVIRVELRIYSLQFILEIVELVAEVLEVLLSDGRDV